MWDLHNTNYTFLRVDPGRRVPCKENEGGLPHASPSPRHRIFSPTISPSGWSTSRQIPAPQTPNGISSYLASSSLPSHVGCELAFCAAPECRVSSCRSPALAFSASSAGKALPRVRLRCCSPGPRLELCILAGGAPGTSHSRVPRIAYQLNRSLCG